MSEGDSVFGEDRDGAAFAAARAELERLKAFGDKLGRLGAQTASMSDRERRAAVQDANLAAFEETSACAAESALTRMRALLDALGTATVAGETTDDIRAQIDEAADDIGKARDAGTAELARRIADILNRAGGTANPESPERGASPGARPGAGSHGSEDFEPFGG